jgi:hypothetical protein
MGKNPRISLLLLPLPVLLTQTQESSFRPKRTGSPTSCTCSLGLSSRFCAQRSGETRFPTSHFPGQCSCLCLSLSLCLSSRRDLLLQPLLLLLSPPPNQNRVILSEVTRAFASYGVEGPAVALAVASEVGPGFSPGIYMVQQPAFGKLGGNFEKKACPEEDEFAANPVFREQARWWPQLWAILSIQQRKDRFERSQGVMRTAPRGLGHRLRKAVR